MAYVLSLVWPRPRLSSSALKEVLNHTVQKDLILLNQIQGGDSDELHIIMIICC